MSKKPATATAGKADPLPNLGNDFSEAADQENSPLGPKTPVLDPKNAQGQAQKDLSKGTSAEPQDGPAAAENAQKQPENAENPAETAEKTDEHAADREIHDPPAPDTAQKPIDSPAAAAARERLGAMLPSESIASEAWGIRIELPVLAPAEMGRNSFGQRRVRHVDARLTPVQGEALRYLISGLRSENCEDERGRPVYQPADAVRWLLDRVAEQLPVCQQMLDVERADREQREAARQKKREEKAARAEAAAAGRSVTS